MSKIKNVLSWLKKYAAWIAIAQAIIWPLGIAYDKLSPKYGIMVHPDVAVIHEVLLMWHVTFAKTGVRSRDECEFLSAKGLYKGMLPCSDFKWESDMIIENMKAYGVDRYGKEEDYILQMLYYKNEWLSPSVKKEFGGFVDE